MPIKANPPIHVGAYIVTGKVYFSDRPMWTLSVNSEPINIVDLVADNYGSGAAVEFVHSAELNQYRPFLDLDRHDFSLVEVPSHKLEPGTLDERD